MHLPHARHPYIHTSSVRLIPFYALIKGNTRPSKYIQSATNSKIDLSLTADMDLLKVLEMPRTSRVCNRNCTPFSQLSDQIFVNTLLQAFHICRVDEELGAVRFQE